MRIRKISIPAVALLAGCGILLGGTPDGQGFASPEAAAKALVNAAKNHDVDEVLKIIGPSGRDIVITTDAVADENARKAFIEKVSEKMRAVADPDHPGQKILEIGADRWPFPIPIVKVNGKWYFDVEQGNQAILLRRIGDNELTAINVCQGFVEAEFDYAERDPMKSGHAQYAQLFISSPGQRDGLYWKSDDPNDESPMGDAIAKAISEGYKDKSQPYHGYYFKVLTGRGAHVPGGAMSYLENGAMTRGFAVIAWPAEYKVTGVMTFEVDKTGILYEKDLGEKTAEIAAAVTEYDPDTTWNPVPNSGGE